MPNSRDWFVSDTHFCAHRTEHIEAFERLCNLPSPGDKLVLLGDIFEIWVSDDLATESDQRIERCIASCVNRGVNVFFMHGNRDFMVGQAFRDRTKVALIADPSIWTLPNGRQVVLTHGDWFCTDDANYRRYRAVIRNKLFQFGFRHLPKSIRLSIAHKIRSSSIKAHEAKGNRSYDANLGLIEHYYKRFAPINTMIMGHTHLPNLHINNGNTRLVLGDWRDTLWYGLASKENGFELIEASLDLNHTQVRHRF